jgi:hypothetical protein
MTYEVLVGESWEQKPPDGMMVLLVLRDKTLAFDLKLRDTEEVEIAHELLRAPANGIPRCARGIGDLVWTYAYNDTILVVKTNEVFVVAASDVLPPETRNPRDGIQSGTRNLGQWMEVQVVVEAVEAVAKELLDEK